MNRRNDKVILLVCVYLSLWMNVFATSMPEVSAEGAVLLETRTNTILYEKNGRMRLYPASITKILTGQIILDMLELSDTLIKSTEANLAVPLDSSHIGLLPGDKYTVEDGMNGLMIGSDNYIAYDMAIKASGSIDAFAKRMNEVAKESGAIDSNFTNPHGYHDPNHYTTPYDMSQIARSAFLNEELCKITIQPRSKVTMLNKNKDIIILNSNRLVKESTDYYNPNVVATKTGFHDDAKQTVVAKAVYDDLELIAVVMKTTTPKQYADVNTLLKYGEENFTTTKNLDGTYTLVNKTVPMWAGNIVSEDAKLGWSGISMTMDEQSMIALDDFVKLMNAGMPNKVEIRSSEILHYLGMPSTKQHMSVTRGEIAQILYYSYHKWQLPVETMTQNPYIPDIEYLTAREQEAIRFNVRHGLLGTKDVPFKSTKTMKWQEAIELIEQLRQ